MVFGQFSSVFGSGTTGAGNRKFFYWMAGRGAMSLGGQALDAVFNQLVRSRAQLLVAE